MRRRNEEQPNLYEEDVVDLANTLQQAASSRKSVPKPEVADAVDQIAHHAAVRGLVPDVLETLVDVVTVTPCYLDQSIAGKVVKALVPRRKVADSVVIKVIACLGNGQRKPAPAIQIALLRWLVMVYDVLESHVALSKMYGILFNLLDMISLRPYVCHILSLLTKRAFVKPFRIQALLELKRTVGSEPALNALIQVYKMYYPDVIIDDPGTFRRGIFAHPDPEWMEQLLFIQSSHATVDKQQPVKTAFQVDNSTDAQVSKKRRIEIAVIPRVHTYRAIESSITLEEVQGPEDFVSKLHKIDFPNQFAAALDSPLLQRLISLRRNDASIHRIDNWLAANFDVMLRVSSNSTPGVKTRFGILLEKLLRYTRMSRTLFPAAEEFLKKYVHVWDGKLHQDVLLSLLSFAPLSSFDELLANYLNPLEHILSNNDPASASKLLTFYTELLRNWAIAYSNRTPDKEDLDVEATTIRKFIKHVGKMSLIVQHSSKEAAIVIDGILSFYECASTLPWENNLFSLELPPDPLVYHFVFLGDAMVLSRICGILSSYKSGFDIAYRRGEVDGQPALENCGYPQAHVDHFNGFLMDICNCLWRNRAFMKQGADPSTDPAAIGCNIPEVVTQQLTQAAAQRGEPLKLLFSFSHSPMLAQLSADCFRDLEEAAGVDVRHSGPVTLPTLKALSTNGGIKLSHLDYRIAVLKDLQEKGLVGMGDFMYNTMISLRNAQGKRG